MKRHIRNVKNSCESRLKKKYVGLMGNLFIPSEVMLYLRCVVFCILQSFNKVLNVFLDISPSRAGNDECELCCL